MGAGWRLDLPVHAYCPTDWPLRALPSRGDAPSWWINSFRTGLSGRVTVAGAAKAGRSGPSHQQRSVAALGGDRRGVRVLVAVPAAGGVVVVGGVFLGVVQRVEDRFLRILR